MVRGNFRSFKISLYYVREKRDDKDTSRMGTIEAAAAIAASEITVVQSITSNLHRNLVRKRG